MSVIHDPNKSRDITLARKLKSLAGYRVLLLCVIAALIGAGVVIAVATNESEAAIVSKFPAPGAVAFPHSKVQITFDRPIKPEPLTFRLQAQLPDGSYEDVPAAVEIAKHYASAVINPYKPLPPGNVRVSISAPSMQLSEWMFEVRASPLDSQRTDGNILLVLGGGSRFGPFYGEILRAEGFTNFVSIPASALRSTDLGTYQKLIVSGELDAPSLVKISDRG